jgi:GDPmannose 4,6-dehydratase
VREFCEVAFKCAGIDLYWKGKDEDEKGFDKKNDKCLIEIDKKYYRPTEVELLLGNPAKAERILNWKPKVSFLELVEMMVKHDIENE